MGKVSNKEAKQFVTCYYCGRRVPRSKAVPVYIKPNLVPTEIKEDEKPEFVFVGAQKVYVCLSCARFRGLSMSDWKRSLAQEARKRKIKELLKSLKINVKNL